MCLLPASRRRQWGCEYGDAFYLEQAVERTQGKVKWFNDVKGFGFISGDGGQDIFVHHTAILAEGYRSLKEGDVVEYELEPGPKGLKAVNVRAVSAQQPAIV